MTHWIDVSPSNGNLLALETYYENIEIYDRRESKFVKTFSKVYPSKNITSFDACAPLLRMKFSLSSFSAN